MVLRGSTDRLLDDLERAVDDGVNTFKVCSCSVQLLTLRWGHPLSRHIRHFQLSQLC